MIIFKLIGTKPIPQELYSNPHELMAMYTAKVYKSIKSRSWVLPLNHPASNATFKRDVHFTLKRKLGEGEGKSFQM